MSDQPTSVHGRVGGDDFFTELVDRFYRGVAMDPLLRPLYPDDLTDSIAWLRGFLIQYWGGSTAYSDARGHPRLRMRHNPFVIGEAERDHWLAHMTKALDETVADRGVDEATRNQMADYFAMAAEAMRNH